MAPFTTSDSAQSGMPSSEVQHNVRAYNNYVAQHTGRVQHANMALNAVMGVRVPGTDRVMGVPFAFPKPIDSGLGVRIVENIHYGQMRNGDQSSDSMEAQATNTSNMDVQESEQPTIAQVIGLAPSAQIAGVQGVGNGADKVREEDSINLDDLTTQIPHNITGNEHVVASSTTAAASARSRSLSDITPPGETQPRVVIDLSSPTPVPAAERTRPPALNLAGATYSAYNATSGAPAIDLYRSPAPSSTKEESESSTSASHELSSSSSLVVPPAPDLMVVNAPHYWSEELLESLKLWAQHPNMSVISRDVLKVRFCREAHAVVSQSSGLLTPPLSATGLYDAATHHHTSVIMWRVLLPECARAPHDHQLFRDWIILRSETEASPFATIKDIGPRPVADTADQPTFWLCAFPTAAIGNIRMGYMPGRAGQVVGTNLALHTGGMVPLMYGRNATPWFLEHWLKACGEGVGSLQVTSSEALPLHPLEFLQ